MLKLKHIYSRAIKKLRGCSIVNSSIDKTSKVESGSYVISSQFGKYSYCGYDCTLINVKVGNYCSIANNVKVGGVNHNMEWASTSPVFYKGRDSVRKKFVEFNRTPTKRTIMGSDVWIGDGAWIKQGVTIGNGAVVGMGSVVTKDVPPYSIVGGNPAHLIRMRFCDDIITLFEDIKWWELDDDKLSQCAEYIKEPLKFIEAVKRIK